MPGGENMQGFVVQNSVLQVEENCKYRGIFRYRSWTTTHISDVYSQPPEYGTEENAVFEFMDRYLEEKFTETETYLCDSFEAAAEYAKALKGMGENIRVLFVRTADDPDKREPDNLFPAVFKFLGYDVIYHCGFYSAVYDDLYINVPKPLQRYAGMLNSDGIFADFSAAADFLSDIDLCIAEGFDIEPSYGFDIVKLYEAGDLQGV